jgi:hypothetical protein
MTWTGNREFYGCLIVGVVLMLGWYASFVRPLDEARGLIIECMTDQDDVSRDSYEFCISYLRGE